MALRIAPLFSGSSGNCILIQSDRVSVLVDAGVSCARIERELRRIGKDPSQLSGILITHEHSDHISGVDVLMRKYDLPVYANEATMCELERKLKEPVLKNMRVIDAGDFYIEDLNVTPFHISHDAADPFGYAFSSGGKKVSVMTDLGRVTKSVLAAVKGSNIVLLESNHDVDMLYSGSYPYYLKRRILSATGHLSNDDAAKAAFELVKMGVRGLLLGHLSKNNNQESLAMLTVCNYLAQNGVIKGKHVAVEVTHRDGCCGVYDAR